MKTIVSALIALSVLAGVAGPPARSTPRASISSSTATAPATELPLRTPSKARAPPARGPFAIWSLRSRSRRARSSG